MGFHYNVLRDFQPFVSNMGLQYIHHLWALLFFISFHHHIIIIIIIFEVAL